MGRRDPAVTGARVQAQPDAEPVAMFYRRFAEVYVAIADDRDFGAEARELRALVAAPRPRVAELFAGPAYHARALVADGASVTCFESEAAMIEQARRAPYGDDLEMVPGELPGTLGRMPDGSFDLAIAMRFSLGYLDRPELAELFWQLGRVLAPGGVFAVELHDLAGLRDGLTDLAIRSRDAVLPDDTRVRCVWPAAGLRWADDDWRVTMDIEVEVEGRPPMSFASQEQIFSSGEVRWLAAAHGGLKSEPAPDERPGLVLEILRRPQGEA